MKGKTGFNRAYSYPYTVVVAFGILGNILVIRSILKHKKNVLKSNYYFFVLHLAICDLAVLIIYLYQHIELYWLQNFHSSTTISVGIVIAVSFHLAGVSMMLIISLLRYRATVHPSKTAISRQTLKVVCALLYLGALITACGTGLRVVHVDSKLFLAFFVYFVPTIFMVTVYYKIARSLKKQNKYMKRVCSNAMTEREPDTSFNILRYIRNRRVFLVCLSTVLCYGIPVSMWLTWAIVDKAMEYDWAWPLFDVLQIAGSYSVKPLIYGILDKKLLTFCKCCC